MPVSVTTKAVKVVFCIILQKKKKKKKKKYTKAQAKTTSADSVVYDFLSLKKNIWNIRKEPTLWTVV